MALVDFVLKIGRRRETAPEPAAGTEQPSLFPDGDPFEGIRPASHNMLFDATEFFIPKKVPSEALDFLYRLAELRISQERSSILAIQGEPNRRDEGLTSQPEVVDDFVRQRPAWVGRVQDIVGVEVRRIPNETDPVVSLTLVGRDPLGHRMEHRFDRFNLEDCTIDGERCSLMNDSRRREVFFSISFETRKAIGKMVGLPVKKLVLDRALYTRRQ